MFSTRDRVVVVSIINADRAAGHCASRKPPKRLIGQRGTVTRRLISWDGMWVGFGKWTRTHGYTEKFVFAPEELKLVRRGR